MKSNKLTGSSTFFLSGLVLDRMVTLLHYDMPKTWNIQSNFIVSSCKTVNRRPITERWVDEERERERAIGKNIT